MAFYGPGNSLMTDSDGIVLSGFETSTSDNVTLAARIRRTWSVGADNSSFAESRKYAVGMGKILASDAIDSGDGVSRVGRVYAYDYEGNLIDSVPDPRDYITGANRQDANWGDTISYGNGRFVITNSRAFSPSGYDIENKIKQRFWIYDNDLNLVKSVAASDSNGVGDYYATGSSTDFGVMNGKLYIWDQYYESDGGDGSSPYEGRILRFDLFNEDSTEELIINNPRPSKWNSFGNICIGHNRILWTSDGFDSAGTFNIGAALLLNQDGNLLREIKSPSPVSNGSLGESRAIGCGRIVIGSSEGTTNNKGTIHVYDLNGEHLWSKKPSDFGVSYERGFGQESIQITNNKIFVTGYGDGQSSVFGLMCLYVFDLDGNYLETYRPDNLGENTLFGAYGFNFDGSNSYGNIFVVGAELDSSGTNTSPTGVRQESIFVLKTGDESYSEYMNKVFDLKR